MIIWYGKLPLWETENSIEKLRDLSRVRNLNKEEMLTLHRDSGLSVPYCEVIKNADGY